MFLKTTAGIGYQQELVLRGDLDFCEELAESPSLSPPPGEGTWLLLLWEHGSTSCGGMAPPLGEGAGSPSGGHGARRDYSVFMISLITQVA